MLIIKLCKQLFFALRDAYLLLSLEHVAEPRGALNSAAGLSLKQDADKRIGYQVFSAQPFSAKA